MKSKEAKQFELAFKCFDELLKGNVSHETLWREWQDLKHLKNEI